MLHIIPYDIGGLGMLAILITKGTRHACHKSHCLPYDWGLMAEMIRNRKANYIA